MGAFANKPPPMPKQPWPEFPATQAAGFPYNARFPVV